VRQQRVPARHVHNPDAGARPEGKRVKTILHPTLQAEGAETRARLAVRAVQDRQSGSTQHKRNARVMGGCSAAS
jgi:hypothetical protein